MTEDRNCETQNGGETSINHFLEGRLQSRLCKEKRVYMSGNSNR